jgi:hypothetical protein
VNDVQRRYRDAWADLVRAEQERDLAEKFLEAARRNHDAAIAEHERARSALLFAAREEIA